MNPRFPIYIPSKGRHDSRLTVKTLEAMDVEYFVIVEAQQYDDYASVIDTSRLLVLDKLFQQEYSTCDDLGDSKSKGPGPARNFASDHALRAGFAWHWVMDDNIKGFFRLNRNLKIRVSTGTIFKAMEDFCLRYKNVSMAGPNYTFFAKRKQSLPPFVPNTRIYSCNLIRNDVPFRWRGRYNEDTDLSLQMLKAGWCTVQFNAFLQGKVETQTLKGGNTEDFYAKDGTLAKSLMQVRLHPDVSELVHKFGRPHHHVDYRPFRSNKLLRVEGLTLPEGFDDYGMSIT